MPAKLIRRKIFEEVAPAPITGSCRAMRTRCVYDPVLAISRPGNALFAAGSPAS